MSAPASREVVEIRIGTCPVCTYAVRAEVTVDLYVSTYLTEGDTKLAVSSRAVKRSSRVTHSCERGEES